MKKLLIILSAIILVGFIILGAVYFNTKKEETNRPGIMVKRNEFYDI